ncbi:MAG: hypothetical protein JSW43_05200, partial [Gemmatimonadota bacterium]
MPDDKSENAPVSREVHLKDLLAVVLRHWRLVILLAVLVSAAAWFSGRNAVTQYRSQLTVQISSPKQVFARMDDIDVDELAMRTDPVLSEALVLTTQRLALKVVAAQALQLEPADPTVFRGDVFRAITVDSNPPLGAYLLRQSGDPGRFELTDTGSQQVLWTGTQAEPVTGPGFSFRVIPQSLPGGGVRFRIVTSEAAAAWVSAGLWYGVRPETNAVDIAFTGTDPTIVPHVLNKTALQLRSDGAERARNVATQRRQYIYDQLERANGDLQGKLRELQAFKEGQQITDLSAEEQAVVLSIQSFEQQRQEILIEISTLEGAVGVGDTVGVEVLNRLAALRSTATNSAILFQIQTLLELYVERRSLTAGSLGLQEGNPQVDAIDQRIRSGHEALRTAVLAGLEGLNNRRQALDDKIGELRTQLQTFPGKETRIAQLEIE